MSFSSTMPTLTSCQMNALELMGSASNVFLTGGAGSGKSFLVRHFLSDKDSKIFPILASTGAAAVLVGGRTFHSFFGLGILEGGVPATIERVAKNREVVRRLKKIEGFIVDEVSMLSGPTLHCAEVICRRVRNSDVPWGGLKVIVVGDFAQLPPVERSNGANKSWAFLDAVWTWSSFSMAYLRTQTRCKDPDYMRVLTFVRSGIVNSEVTDYLNSKMKPLPEIFDGTRLYPLRRQTEDYNLQKLSELKSKEHQILSIASGASKSVELLKKSAPIPEVLNLKEGALVMLRQNDVLGRWVNGTLGHVQKIGAQKLKIELLNGRIAEIEKASFSLMDADGDVVASLTNFPVTLAYASTIHKSQGSTLDRMAVNLQRLWEPGQAYVALSRIVSGEELYIEAWQPQSIRVDSKVAQFYRSHLKV